MADYENEEVKKAEEKVKAAEAAAEEARKEAERIARESGKAGIRVTKEGLVTVPKHCKKGTYKIRVFADGTQNYKAKCYYVTVTVRTWGWQMAISQGICRMQPAKRAPQGVPPYCALSSMEFS